MEDEQRASGTSAQNDLSLVENSWDAALVEAGQLRGTLLERELQLEQRESQLAALEASLETALSGRASDALAVASLRGRVAELEPVAQRLPALEASLRRERVALAVVGGERNAARLGRVAACRERNAARSELSEVRAELAAVRADLETARSVLEDQAARLQDSEAAREAADTRQTETASELSAARAEVSRLAPLEGRLREAESELRAACGDVARLTPLEGRLREAESELQAARGDVARLSPLEGRLHRAFLALVAVADERDAAILQRDGAFSVLDTAAADIAERRERAAAALAAARAERNGFRAERDDDRRLIALLESRVVAAQAERHTALQQRDAANGELAATKYALDALICLERRWQREVQAAASPSAVPENTSAAAVPEQLAERDDGGGAVAGLLRLEVAVPLVQVSDGAAESSSPALDLGERSQDGAFVEVCPEICKAVFVVD